MFKKFLNTVIFLLFFTPSAFGGIDFDGVDDIVTAGTGVDGLWAGGGTVMVWVYCDTINSTLRYIVSKSFPTAGYWIVYQVDTGGGAGTEFSLTVDFDGGDGYWHADGDFTTGSWVHLAVTYNSDALANDPIFYVNGSAVTIDLDTTPIGSRPSDADLTIEIGNRSSDLARDFDGRINDLKLIDGILTPTQILNEYTAKLKDLGLTAPANVQAYWPFDDHTHNDTANSADGLVFRDRAGTNNGTASGCNAQAETILNYPSSILIGQ